MKTKGVVVLYNEADVRVGPGQEGWQESDAGVMAEADDVAAAVATLGLSLRRARVRRFTDLIGAVASGEEPVIFNLVETLAGEPNDFAFVPEICRALGRGCTGNDGECQVLCLDKWRTKAVLAAAGIPVPSAALLAPGSDLAHADLPAGPLIVKPLLSDGSEGIDTDSVVQGAGPELAQLVARIHEQFRQPALVEQYIDGREINAAVLQKGERPEVLPLSEIAFDGYPPGKPRVVGYSAKWKRDSFEFGHTPRRIPAPLTEAVEAAVRKAAVMAWRATGCRDYARVDFRVDADGRPWVLEVNPNPAIGRQDGFAAALQAGGIPYESFVEHMLENAMRRARREKREAAEGTGETPQASLGGRVRVRRTERDDRKAILAMVTECGFFRPDEVGIAREVLDDSLTRGDEMEYYSMSAELEGEPVGWVCYGPTACTIGTFDIYWLVVKPGLRRSGIGSALMRTAEGDIVSRGGRIAVLETSGRPLYDSTRGFYLKLGYGEGARLSEFYAPGDDKVVYTKKL